MYPIANLLGSLYFSAIKLLYHVFNVNFFLPLPLDLFCVGWRVLELSSIMGLDDSQLEVLFWASHSSYSTPPASTWLSPDQWADRLWLALNFDNKHHVLYKILIFCVTVIFNAGYISAMLCNEGLIRQQADILWLIIIIKVIWLIRQTVTKCFTGQTEEQMLHVTEGGFLPFQLQSAIKNALYFFSYERGLQTSGNIQVIRQDVRASSYMFSEVCWKLSNYIVFVQLKAFTSVICAGGCENYKLSVWWNQNVWQSVFPVWRIRTNFKG